MIPGLVSAAAPVVVHVSSNDDWTRFGAVATEIAAIATAILAYVTWRMAQETKKVAETARDEAHTVSEQVDLSREELHASIRPWLAPALRWTEYDGSHVRAQHGLIELKTTSDEAIQGTVPIRNIGPGIAVVDLAKSCVLGHQRENLDLRPYVPLRTSVPVIPTGEISKLTFIIRRTSAAWADLSRDVFTGTALQYVGDFGLDVYYSDWAGGQTTRIRILLGRDDAQAEWHMLRIEYHDAISDVLVTSVDSSSSEYLRHADQGLS